MKIISWFLYSLPGMGLDEPVDLESWRNWLVKIMIVFSIIFLPIAMIPSLPMLIADEKYPLVALDFGVFLILAIRLFSEVKSYKPNAYLFIAILYTMMISFLIELGPVHARPAWLVMCAVMAALMFGKRGAIIATGINIIILAIIYWVIGPENEAWAAERARSIQWAVFILNVSIITLAVSLTVGLLLDKLDQSLKHERDMHKVLAAERDKLKSINIQFKDEIEQRKQAEEAYRESEERFKTFFEYAPDAYYMNDLEGNFLDGNKAAEELIGYPKEELIGKNFLELDLLPQAEVPKAASILAKHTMGQTTGPHELILRRKDGKNISVEIRAFPLKIKGQELVLGIARDITERKQAEEDRKILQAQLMQAQKMEAIGTLAGGIAHDFNNILSPIMIQSELIREELAPDSLLHHNVNEIYQAAIRAKNLVKQILALSRRKEQERTCIQVKTVLKETLKLLRSAIPATIEIRQNIKTESDTVLADPTQIHQVLMNLCTNAAQAMSEKGGVLEVGLSAEEVNYEVSSAFHDLGPGSYVRLTVSDTGHGMEPSVLERIFEPYFTTKEPGKGTGLGLAVVHGIVKGLGGEITVASEPGKGTIFHVWFPRTELTVSPAIEREIAVPHGTERVLVVDDESAIVSAVQKMLERLGYDVTSRTSSMEALEAFRNRPNRFDLVITDMTMPNMTGSELTRELISIRPGVPVIMCTGFSEKIDEKMAKEMGISAFIMKPVSIEEMAHVIRKVLDEKRPPAKA